MLSLSVMFLSTPSSKYLQHTAIMVFYPELPLLKELILQRQQEEKTGK